MIFHEGGGNCLKYLKRGGTKKRGGETKILRRGKVSEGVGAIKTGGWNPLMNYDYTNYNLYRCFC